MHRVHGCHSWFYSLYRWSLCRWWCSVHWMPVKIAKNTEHLWYCCWDHGTTHIMAEKRRFRISATVHRHLQFTCRPVDRQLKQQISFYILAVLLISMVDQRMKYIVELIWPLASCADCPICGSNPDSDWQPSWEFTTRLSCLFSCTDVKRGPY